MRYSLFAFASVVALAGCAVSSGILPAGPNTYTLTERVAPIAGGGMEAQRVALEKANSFCKSQGPLAARVTRIAWHTAAAGYGSST
jgi:hypothetical protein